MKSINRVLEFKKYLKNNYFNAPYIGKNPNYESFSKYMEIPNKARSYMIDDISIIDKDKPKDSIEYNFGSGNPSNRKISLFRLLKYKFLLKKGKLSQYNSSLGSNKDNLLKFINKQGIIFDRDEYLDKNNILPTMSVTHAFDLILKTICRPYDVVLFTAPCYCLFAYMPERIGAESRFVELKEEDNYVINPKELKRTINLINKELNTKYKNKLDYIPKVVAFLNENPHNPIGNVLTKNDLNLIKEISDICAKEGVFIIDDLIYQGTEYNQNLKAFPFATLSKNFSNVITLYGVSKSFCIPGVRAGFIVANKTIINESRNQMFYQMDSYSYLNETILSSFFNEKTYKSIDQKMFLNKTSKLYEKNYNIIKEFINRGTTKLQLIKNLEPESGFFGVIDFSKYKGTSYKEYKIIDEKSLLCFLYKYGDIRFITGEAFLWPKKEQLIGRITYSMSSKELKVFLKHLEDTLYLLGD